jgi:hypothetical protein
MSANNVIKFPKFTASHPQTGEELGQYFDQNKKAYIDYITDHYCSHLYNKLGSHGFQILDDDFITNFSYSVETIRCALYQTLGLEHPLEEHIIDMLEIIDLDDDLDDDINDDINDLD